jgi:hypothetical protein
MVFPGEMHGQAGRRDQLGLLDHVALAMEGPSTPGGEEFLPHSWRYSILASLENLVDHGEERPTTCACLCGQPCVTASQLTTKFQL